MKQFLKENGPFSPVFLLMSACFFGSFFFVLLQGGKLAFMLFLTVSVLCAYLLLGNWSGITETGGSRILNGIQAGGTAAAGTQPSVSIQVRIPGIWPIPYVIVKDRLLRGYKKEELTVEATLIPDWNRRGTIEYQLPPLRRGVYQFGMTDVSTEDLFGLFEHTGKLQLPASFIVPPATVKIRDWKQFHVLYKGSWQFSATAQAVRETTELNGVRDYMPGDRLSRIHWGATARTGILKSKDFERESLPKAILILDRRESAYLDPGDFELAVSIAASLCEYGMDRDLAFGLLSAGADFAYYEPGRGKSHYEDLLGHLLHAEADGQHPILSVIQDRSRFWPPGSFLAVISPRQDEGMLQMFGWIRQQRMNPCHVWIRSGASGFGAEDWLPKLKQNGCLAYSVRSLQELPAVLGG